MVVILFGPKCAKKYKRESHVNNGWAIASSTEYQIFDGDIAYGADHKICSSRGFIDNQESFWLICHLM